MDDLKRTKHELVSELHELRERVAEFEKSSSKERSAGTWPNPDQIEWEKVFDAVHDLVMVVDKDYRILRMNEAMASRLGSRPDNMVGVRCYEAVHATRSPPASCPHSLVLTDGQARCCDLWEETLAGQFSLSLVPLHDSQGDLVGTVHVARDITERFHIQEALRASRNDLKRHVRERTFELATANARLQREIDEHRRSQEALEQSEANLRDVFQNMPDFVVVVDSDGVIQLANRGVGGLAREELLGKSGFCFMVTESEEVCRSAFEHALSKGEPQAVECRDIFGLIWDCRIIPLSPKADAQVMIICTDVTERRKAENLIQIQRDLSVALNATTSLEEALRDCCNTASQVSGMDCSGVYLVNQAGTLNLAAHHGVPADFAAGVCLQGPDSPLARAAHSGIPAFYHVQQASARNRRLLLDEGFRAVAIVPVRHEGATVACLALASRTLEQVPLSGRNALEAVAATIGGAIARIRAEESLRVFEHKLESEQRLLRRLITLQERERKLVSYEIHDGFVQDVTGAQMHLEAACAKLRSQGRSIPKELTRVGDLLGKGLVEARRLIGDLRPMIIDERGIVEAINYLVAEEASQDGLQIDFVHELQDERFDPVLEANVFRIVQEALTNVKRHSQSNAAAVRLTQVDGLLRVEIRDRGVGFDPENIPEDRFGIRGIRERARLFGGKVTIHSGAVTEITVEVPVSLYGERDDVPVNQESDKIDTSRSTR
jgi:PAS domain S-box-containing protein